MVEIETQYSIETYREYFWFSLFKGKYYRISKATFPFIAILIFFLLTLSIFWLRSGVYIAVSAAGSFVCILFYIMAYIRPRQYVKNAPLLFQTKNIFIFDDDAITLSQKGTVSSGEGTIKYEALYKAYETNHAIYLYISPVQAYLLSKNDFVKGTSNELRMLLQNKLPANKYVVCK